MMGGKQPPGFTIVEVLIVLAVSGLIFLSAALMIAGKQNRTGFITSINDLQAQIQQTMNEVINGYYPKYSNFNCTQGTAAPPSLIFPGTKSQGTNGGINSSGSLSGCLFLGKAIQFAASTSGGTNPNSPTIEIFPVIGNLEGSNNLPAQSLSDSYPELLAPGTSPTYNSTFTTEFTGKYTMQYGLRVAWMCYSNTGSPCSQTTNTAVLAFATSPEASSGGNSLTPGNQQVNFLPVPGSSLGQHPANMVDFVDNYFTTNASSGLVVNPESGIEICIADDTTNQSGLFTIGGGNSQPSVTLSIKQVGTNCL